MTSLRYHPFGPRYEGSSNLPDRPVMRILKKWKRFPRLEKFNLWLAPMGDQELMILTTEAWNDLQVLDVGQCHLGAEHMKDFAQGGSRWKRLRELNLSGNVIGSEGLLILAKATWALQHIDLHGTHLEGGPGGAAVAAFCTSCVELHSLRLNSNNLGEEGLKEMLKVPLPHLSSLDIGYTDLTSAAGALLAQNAAQWPHLRELEIGGNPLKRGFEKLCKAKWPLEELYVSRTKLGVCKAKSLRAVSASWPGLKILECSGNRLKPEGLEGLLYGRFAALEELGIGDNYKLGAEGSAMVAAAAGHGRLPALSYFDLSTINLDDEGMRTFCGTSWPHLTYLDLGESKFGADGASALGKAVHEGRLSSLKELDVSKIATLDATAVQEMLIFTWPALEQLLLLECPLGDVGAEALAMAASNLPALRLLNVSNCQFNLKESYKSIFQAKWKALECVYCGEQTPALLKGLLELQNADDAMFKWKLEIKDGFANVKRM